MGQVMVLAETDGRRMLPGTLPALAFAQAFASATGGTFSLLVVGAPGVEAEAEALRGVGAERIICVPMAELEPPTADRVAAVCAEIMRRFGADSLAATASTFGKDVLPRVAGLLDLPMLSDVLSIAMEGGRPTFRRPMYAGNLIATVQVRGDKGVFSVRGTAFGKPETASSLSPVETLAAESVGAVQGTEWIGLDAAEQSRPELTNARVVVSGGRPLRDAETFERLIGGLADKLGGAVGATRAAVDSGIAPNELQVGQTGKIVAPELYIAAGISGSVQHLAGMKDSKVIVAINNDPDAPIFGVADYGLVADLHQAIPEMLEKL